MAPSITLRLGNIFDAPTDVIVLPCSTAGTITAFVAAALIDHSIPHPGDGMMLGDVEFFPFEGGDEIAQHVAFAASVRGNSSSVEAVRTIGARLGQFTRDNPGARRISTPLLGAGAGGLSAETVVDALTAGFGSSADPGSTLIIYVLHNEVYERLRGARRRATPTNSSKRRVFISHTSKNDTDIDWVKRLALYLIQQGFQARLDLFHLRRGMDFAQWMTNELSIAEKVLIIGNESYKARADGRLGGVGWETMLIQGDISNLPPDATKYQVVVRTAELAAGIPTYLKTRLAYHVPENAAEASFRVDLVRDLYDRPIDPSLEDVEFTFQ